MQAALQSQAALLHSDALRERLEQGRNEPFVAELLDAPDAATLAEALARGLGHDENAAAANLVRLERYLQRIVVKPVSFSDFRPSRRTLERDDLAALVDEFRAFLQAALDDGDDELTIIELQP